MELNPSWEVASCADTQAFPNILWTPKVHYRLHKSPPLDPILIQIMSVYTTPSYLSTFQYYPLTHFYIFLVVSFLPVSPPKSHKHSSSPHSCYMPCPPQPLWLHHSNHIRVPVIRARNLSCRDTISFLRNILSYGNSETVAFYGICILVTNMT
jgi:hypothetical protein